MPRISPWILVAAAAAILAPGSSAQTADTVDIRTVRAAKEKSGVQEKVHQEMDQKVKVSVTRAAAEKPETHEMEISLESDTVAETSEEVLAVDADHRTTKVARTWDKASVTAETRITADGESKPGAKESQSLPFEGATVEIEQDDAGECTVKVKSGTVPPPFPEILQAASPRDPCEVFSAHPPVKLGESWVMEQKEFDRLVGRMVETGFLIGFKMGLAGQGDPKVKVENITGEIRIKLAEVTAEGKTAVVSIDGTYGFEVTGTLNNDERKVAIDVDGKGSAKLSGSMEIDLQRHSPRSLHLEEGLKLTISLAGEGPQGAVNTEISATVDANRDRSYKGE